LIRQKSSQKTALNKEEIGKLLKQCRNAYKSLIEDAYPPQISGESYKMVRKKSTEFQQTHTIPVAELYCREQG
jgi:flagellar biosynthesis component FlhA